MRGNELISQIGREGKQMDQKSWDEWLEATTQAAARRAQR